MDFAAIGLCRVTGTMFFGGFSVIYHGLERPPFLRRTLKFRPKTTGLNDFFSAGATFAPRKKSRGTVIEPLVTRKEKSLED
ncbi:MAG: hypothetical protein LLF97_00885 [Planctomycetaceae bacterium]|nr:hypothetical protein [Planctomycetaceae bacterium]